MIEGHQEQHLQESQNNENFTLIQPTLVDAGTNESDLSPSPNTNLNVQILNIDYNMEYIWSNFQIPWSKMSQELINLCERGERSTSAITDIVHFVVNELRQIKDLIPSKVLKTMAAKMVQKYPKMFTDVDDDGVPLGDGSSTIFCKLYERAAYLRRPHKRKSCSDLPVGPKMKKKKVNVMAGCSNWAPENIQENISTEEENNEKEKLRKPNLNHDDLMTLMENTYTQQRLFLNNIENPPTVEMIKNEWPILFTIEGIYWHFKKLTGCNLKELSVNLKAKAKKIICFGLKKNIISDLEEESEIVALQIIAKHFKEDFNMFLMKVKVSTSFIN